MEQKTEAKVEEQAKATDKVEELSLEELQDVAGGGVVVGSYDAVPTTNGIIVGTYD